MNTSSHGLDVFNRPFTRCMQQACSNESKYLLLVHPKSGRRNKSPHDWKSKKFGGSDTDRGNRQFRWILPRVIFSVNPKNARSRFKNSEPLSEQKATNINLSLVLSFRNRWSPDVGFPDISLASLPAPWYKIRQNRGAGFLIRLYLSFSWPHENPNTKFALRLPLIFEQRKSTPSLVWEKMCSLCLCMRLSLEERFVLSGQFSQLYDVRLQGCNFLFHDFIFLSLQGQFPALCSP